MNRREVLGALGAASASSLLWALGCGGRQDEAPRAPIAREDQVRAWLHDAVARLAAAGFAAPHALALTRRRTAAANDVLGAAVRRARADAVVLAVRDQDGALREQVTADVSADGVAAAVSALAAAAKPARVDFGRPIIAADGSPQPHDEELLAFADAIRTRDEALNSRIVYRAELVEIDDARVWSVAPGRDLEQRLVRVRQVATRVAWNGTRPIVAEVSRAWLGPAGSDELGKEAIEDATRGALALMTPAAFEDGEHAIVLAPSVVASIIDAAVPALLTTAAMRLPEVARRLELGAGAASAAITLVDDPTAGGNFDAYGGFHFDDEGEPASALMLVDRGHIVGRIADQAGVAAGRAPVAGRGRRPGHVGRVEPAASHLVLAPGTAAQTALRDDGFVLEGALGAVVDPASDRLVVSIARARELAHGNETGRVFGELELVANLGALLASVAAVSKETETFGFRDEVDGRPRWRSIAAPWLSARGTVRARRRPA
ncbi:MAG TPA: metallopeptidase TldD-related protein [Kofleriaceae bacterium]|nr:metallopeptidase TldD-related protein [Kofleriaceae bacterium]